MKGLAGESLNNHQPTAETEEMKQQLENLRSNKRAKYTAMHQNSAPSRIMQRYFQLLTAGNPDIHILPAEQSHEVIIWINDRTKATISNLNLIILW